MCVTQLSAFSCAALSLCARAAGLCRPPREVGEPQSAGQPAHLDRYSGGLGTTCADYPVAQALSGQALQKKNQHAAQLPCQESRAAPQRHKLPRRRSVRPRAAARCGLACCALPRLDRLTGCSAAARRASQCRWRTSPCATSCAGSHGAARATSSTGTHTLRPCPHRQPRAESRPGGQRGRLCAREHRRCWCASKHVPCALWGAGAGLRAG